MNAVSAVFSALFIAGLLLAAPARAQDSGSVLGQVAMDLVMNEAVNGTIQEALSPSDKPDPARFKLYSEVTDEAKLLHPLIIKQLKSIAGSNEYWTGAQFILYIAKSKDQMNLARAQPANVQKPAVTLVVLAKEKQVMLDVAPQLTAGLPGNMQAAIINRVMLPNFHKGRMQRGIIDGTRAILMALQGAYTKPTPAVVPRPTPYNWMPLIVLFMIAAGALRRRRGYYVPRDGYYGPGRGGARGYW